MVTPSPYLGPLISVSNRSYLGSYALARPLQRRAQATRALALHLTSSLMQYAGAGLGVDRVVNAVSRNRRHLLSGFLGGAGMAGGAWAALSVWTSSLGAWGGLAAALGVVGAPLWVPLAGGVAGLTAAGGAAAGLRALSRSRGRRRKLQSIIGLSKMLVRADSFAPEDERVMRKFLQARRVSDPQIEDLLETSPEAGRKLALAHLSRDDRREVARYIFPLVYSGDGIITPAERRRFAKVCEALDLPEGEAVAISRDYRARLDQQWTYLKGLVGRLNYFAEALGFDSREMELLREELLQLMSFDPRRVAGDRRRRALALLGETPPSAPVLEENMAAEAEVMGAYALAQTAVRGARLRQRLVEAFDQLVESQDGLSPERQRKLLDSRRKVDVMHEAMQRDTPSTDRA